MRLQGYVCRNGDEVETQNEELTQFPALLKTSYVSHLGLIHKHHRKAHILDTILLISGVILVQVSLHNDK